MRPAYLPDGAVVGLESALDSLVLLLLRQVIAHATDLQKAFTIAGSNLGAIVVELAIVDVVLMLRIDCKH